MLAAAGPLALTGCGGGGSGGSGGPPPVIVNPAPTPTPIPTPAPTPTPSPTVRAYTASAVTGRIDFYTGNGTALGDTLTQGFLSRGGLYTPGYRGGLSGYVGLGPNGSLSADYADRYKRLALIEHETSLYLLMDAPAEARVATPVTALITSGGIDQAKLKRQLGITGSLFGLATDPNILTYDAVTELASSDQARSLDGAKMFAANLRVIAIVRAFGVMNFPQSSLGNEMLPIQPGDFTRTGECLKAGTNEFLFRNDRMTALATCYQGAVFRPPVTIRPQTLSAIAHLIDAFAAAIGVNLQAPEDQARWRLAVEGWLAPNIARLATTQTDAADAAANAVTALVIHEETRIYGDRLRYNETGTYFTGPDFFALSSGGGSVTLAGSNTLVLSPLFNDFYINPSNADWNASQSRIAAVTVPAAYAGRMSATLQPDGSVALNWNPGGTGAAFLDYTSQHPAGGSRTARIYLRFY